MGYSEANPTEGTEHSNPHHDGPSTAINPKTMDSLPPSEKEITTTEDQPGSTDATGVKKVEAAVLAWDKKTVLAIYAWYSYLFLLPNLLQL